MNEEIRKATRSCERLRKAVHFFLSEQVNLIKFLHCAGITFVVRSDLKNVRCLIGANRIEVLTPPIARAENCAV